MLKQVEGLGRGDLGLARGCGTSKMINAFSYFERANEVCVEETLEPGIYYAVVF